MRITTQSYVNGEIVSQTQPPWTVEDLRLELSRVRWEHETGGCLIPGIGSVPTDAVTQQKVSGAIQHGQLCVKNGATFEIDWELPSGFITLDLNTLETIGMAIANHVEQCFARKAVLLNQILAPGADLPTLAETLHTGWPE